MLKRRKLFFSIIAVILFAAMFMSACGKDADNGQTQQTTTTKAATTATTAQTTTETTADPKLTESVTLKWVFPAAYNNGKDNKIVWDEYNKQLPDYLPNTTVEFEAIAIAEYKTKWDLMMASGEYADIAWTGYLIPYTAEVDKGSYMQIDEIFAKYAPDIQKEIPEWFMNYGKVDEKLYSVPIYKDAITLKLGMYTPKEAYDLAWDPSWNKVFYDNGLPYRATTEEMYDVFEQYMKKLQDAGKLGSGMSPYIWVLKDLGCSLISSDGFLSMIRYPNRGSKWDFTVRNYMELPETKLNFEKMADFYEKGFIRQDVLTLDNPRKFDNTNVGTESSAIWFHLYQDAANPDSEVREILSTDKTKVLDLMQVRVETDLYSLPFDSSSSLAIPRTAKYPERAMALINVMNAEKGIDLYRLLVHGIENVHYTKLSENKIERILPDPANPSYSMENWYFGNILHAFVIGKNTADNAITYLANDLNNQAIKNPLTGIRFDTSSISNEIAQCAAAAGEYWIALRLGGLGDQWEEKYNECLAKLKTAGIDKIISVLQQQVDDFLKLKGLDKNNVIAE